MATPTPKDVKLFGAAISGYCTMVHHALQLKGVAYDYVEVDLKNKSEEFLKLHPVHKKVPILVVDGKPIPESLVILQYVDETWKEHPLLPQDPYLRSKVRFWADFIYQKMKCDAMLSSPSSDPPLCGSTQVAAFIKGSTTAQTSLTSLGRSIPVTLAHLRAISANSLDCSKGHVPADLSITDKRIPSLIASCTSLAMFFGGFPVRRRRIMMPKEYISDFGVRIAVCTNSGSI